MAGTLMFYFILITMVERASSSTGVMYAQKSVMICSVLIKNVSCKEKNEYINAFNVLHMKNPT